MTSDRLDSTALYKHNHVPKKRLLNALFWLWTTFFCLQLFLFLQVGVSHLPGGIFTLEQRCPCGATALPHVGGRKAPVLPGPPPPAGPAAGCGKQPFVLLDESISSKPRPPRLSGGGWFSPTRIFQLLSGVHSQLLKKKGKQGLLVEGCRCSGICLCLKNSFSPALYHIHEFLLYCTANGYIKHLQGLHHSIADSSVAEYDDTTDCLAG